MALSNQIGAYADCFELLDQAIESPKGLRFEAGNRDLNRATVMSMRLQQARTLHREQSKRIYKSDDPRWGTSIYDPLTIRRPIMDEDGNYWIYIEYYRNEVGKVEILSDDNMPREKNDSQSKTELSSTDDLPADS